MHFSIAVFGFPIAFTDVALACHFALTALGWKSTVNERKFTHNCLNIIFGANGLGKNVEIPQNSIIYDFEQLSGSFYTDLYLSHLREAACVWEFSKTNTKALQERYQIDATYVFPGYVPEMSCLASRETHSGGALFYGIENQRRTTALQAIRQHGVQVSSVNHVIGPQRDALIADAAIVLNIHSRIPASLEIARLGFLWANQKAVLSEDCPEWGIPEGLEEACMYTSYDNLAEAALLLQEKSTLREGIAKRGYEAYKAKPLVDILEKVVGRPVQAVLDDLLPCIMNVGSGQNFIPHCLNVDINPLCQPDIVLDMNQPLEWENTYQTQRFGNISLAPGTFHKIIASELLQYIPNIVQIMKNFLDLLKVGGELDITVPYDLSCGAWQNPATRRAFNENSWQFFGETNGQPCWRDACFEIVDIRLKESERGKELLRKGVSPEQLMTTPRAIDGMRVLLRKRETTDLEKHNFDLGLRPTYKKEYGGWSLAPQ